MLDQWNSRRVLWEVDSGSGTGKDSLLAHRRNRLESGWRSPALSTVRAINVVAKRLVQRDDSLCCGASQIGNPWKFERLGAGNGTVGVADCGDDLPFKKRKQQTLIYADHRAKVFDQVLLFSLEQGRHGAPVRMTNTRYSMVNFVHPRMFTTFSK